MYANYDIYPKIRIEETQTVDDCSGCNGVSVWYWDKLRRTRAPQQMKKENYEIELNVPVDGFS